MTQSDSNPFDRQKLEDELTQFQSRIAAALNGVNASEHFDQGCTPREVVWQDEPVTLYRYRPAMPRDGVIPILLVYALVNRPYILDLEPDRSLIQRLLDGGYPVYLIDWGYPKRHHRYLSLDDYINVFIHRSVKTICRSHEIDAVNLLGVCQGGTLSLCYSAIHPQRVRNLITMITPVDFHTPENRLSQWVQQMDVDLLVDTYGNIPGALLNRVYLALKPFELLSKKYRDLARLAEEPAQLDNFYRMERWLWDCPDQAGTAFREFIQGCFQANGLIKGSLQIGNQQVDLSRITMPLLNIYATADHIVPPSASVHLKKYVASEDYSEFPFKGGHIGIYVSRRAQSEIPATIDSWLCER